MLRENGLDGGCANSPERKHNMGLPDADPTAKKAEESVKPVGHARGMPSGIQTEQTNDKRVFRPKTPGGRSAFQKLCPPPLRQITRHPSHHSKIPSANPAPSAKPLPRL